MSRDIIAGVLMARVHMNLPLTGEAYDNGIDDLVSAIAVLVPECARWSDDRVEALYWIANEYVHEARTHGVDQWPRIAKLVPEKSESIQTVQ